MLIIFIVLSSVWITCGTIFVVRDIQIIDATVPTAELLTDTEKNDIITKSGLMGKNILFNLKEEKIVAVVKSVNPMIKLQTVTAEFPNRVVLKVSRRVPVYYDQTNKKFFDAEMCVVDAPPSASCVEITNANIELSRDDFKVGDIVTGKDERSQCKIEQLKTLAVSGCFDTLAGFKISYNDEVENVGRDRLYLILKIKEGLIFEIIVKPHENFLHALDYTVQYYEQNNKIDGIYRTMYDESDNKLTTRREDE